MKGRRLNVRLVAWGSQSGNRYVHEIMEGNFGAKALYSRMEKLLQNPDISKVEVSKSLLNF